MSNDDKQSRHPFLEVPEAEMEPWRAHPVSQRFLDLLRDSASYHLRESAAQATRGDLAAAATQAGCADKSIELHRYCTDNRTPAPKEETVDTTLDRRQRPSTVVKIPQEKRRG